MHVSPPDFRPRPARPRSYYCGCPRGMYEAHCAAVGVESHGTPGTGCPLCSDGVRRPPPPGDAPTDYLAAVSAVLTGVTPTGASLVGRTEVSVTLPGGLEVGAWWGRAVSREAIVDTVRTALAAGRVGSDAADALYATTCAVTIWLGKDNLTGTKPWWHFEGNLGDLVYGPRGEA